MIVVAVSTLRLDAVLADPYAAEWRQLGDAADDGYAIWRRLLLS